MIRSNINGFFIIINICNIRNSVIIRVCMLQHSSLYYCWCHLLLRFVLSVGMSLSCGCKCPYQNFINLYYPLFKRIYFPFHICFYFLHMILETLHLWKTYLTFILVFRFFSIILFCRTHRELHGWNGFIDDIFYFIL